MRDGAGQKPAYDRDGGENSRNGYHGCDHQPRILSGGGYNAAVASKPLQCLYSEDDTPDDRGRQHRAHRQGCQQGGEEREPK